MKKIIITLPSLTYAMKAMRLLKRNKIKARLIKLSDVREKDGCQYGLEIYEAEIFGIAGLLRNEKIEYGIYDSKQ